MSKNEPKLDLKMSWNGPKLEKKLTVLKLTLKLPDFDLKLTKKGLEMN